MSSRSSWPNSKRKKRRSSARNRSSSASRKRVIAWLWFCLGGLGVAALAWLLLIYPSTPEVSRGSQVALTPKSYGTLLGFSEQLHKHGLVKHRWPWLLYARLRGGAGKLRAHSVMFRIGDSPSRIFALATQSRGMVSVRVRLPEGGTRFDYAVVLERSGVCAQDDFLQATEDRAWLRSLGLAYDSAEGFLFPDTYMLPVDNGGQDTARRLIANWKKRTAPLWQELAERGPDAAAAKLDWGKREIVILASIVEKEAIPRERFKVAGVFFNRLLFPNFVPRRLQADPTILYGCLPEISKAPSCTDSARLQRWQITVAMRSDALNPYNTYRHDGLPPGPIGNPSLDALKAVVSPEKHDYLYFVARGDGTHVFNSDYAQHRLAIDRYLRFRQ